MEIQVDNTTASEQLETIVINVQQGHMSALRVELIKSETNVYDVIASKLIQQQLSTLTQKDFAQYTGKQERVVSQGKLQELVIELKRSEYWKLKYFAGELKLSLEDFTISVLETAFDELELDSHLNQSVIYQSKQDDFQFFKENYMIVVSGYVHKKLRALLVEIRKNTHQSEVRLTDVILDILAKRCTIGYSTSIIEAQSLERDFLQARDFEILPRDLGSERVRKCVAEFAKYSDRSEEEIIADFLYQHCTALETSKGSGPKKGKNKD